MANWARIYSSQSPWFFLQILRKVYKFLKEIGLLFFGMMMRPRLADDDTLLQYDWRIQTLWVL